MTTALLLVCFAAILGEAIDSGLGMMYGTILSPLLIVCGYSPQDVIPCILCSQAIGGAIATLGHHRHGNADFRIGSDDFKIGLAIYLWGMVAVILGTALAIHIPKAWLQGYIGVLVMVMGLVVVFRNCFHFSWRKVMAIGFLSAFNKALSGGGYGPLVSSGLIISGRSGKSAIGTCDFAEAPICLTAFFVWAAMRHSFPDWSLLLALTGGAAIGGLIGPWALSRVKSDGCVSKIVGVLAFGVGALCLFGILKP
jgi:uncharacterized membrane protein YfcA